MHRVLQHGPQIEGCHGHRLVDAVVHQMDGQRHVLALLLDLVADGGLQCCGAQQI